MSGFPIIDLIAGMIFVYFLLSIICSSVVEMILTVVKARAVLLQEWLTKIFSEQIKVGNTTESLGQAIIDHCAITGLSDEKGKSKPPSYIDAKNFTSALLEKLTYDPNDPTSIATDLNTFISKIQQADIISPELKRMFLTYAYEARDKYKAGSDKTVNDVAIFRSKIETWYDSSMDRLTGDLKRRYSRPFTFWVALVSVVLMNADSVNIAKYLYSNPDARAKVAAQAYQLAQDSSTVFNKRIDSLKRTNSADTVTLNQLQSSLQTGLANVRNAQGALNENLPFGWSKTDFQSFIPKKLNPKTKQLETDGLSSFLIILSKILGLAVTTIALMLGAPFWFDLLNKVTNLRGTGGKPASSSDTTNTPAPQAAPITVTVNSNKDEEAAG
ncbi:MAG TPA: hypothetical protein VHB70_00175 [Parafilimonas sp.]|nr:hypothetical protein [Parafilimonas sp.]